ncbi:MAG: DegV family protein [Clostridia bacterium]|nr:DegV family protein [Clostridia bacterium]
MSDYVIFTDSACDIKPELLKEWGVGFQSLTLRFEKDDKEYTDGAIDSKLFYDRMRNGGVAKTAAVNSEMFSNAFEEHLKNGIDLLYLGFSSGLSTTFNSARLAAESLREKYPERKIVVVDTLSASAGFGLLLNLTVEKKNAGATIEEAAAFAEELKYKLCHWFTVDDLVYLKRGGRISPTVAFVGNVLGIKPVLHMDNEGHLINMFKVRGRKTSVAALADKYGELAVDKEGGKVFISHGDCLKDAEELAKILKDRYNATVELITNVGTVIGAHSGPGTLALFFVGTER